MLTTTLNFTVVLLSVLVSVAFLTLYERKILSLIQMRQGPNKLGALGLLQPFSDALKLFTKELLHPRLGNHTLFMLSPSVALTIALLMWFSFHSSAKPMSFPLAMVFVLCCQAASVYPVLAAGWSSNSKLSLLGGLRAVAQSISYEVSFAILTLNLMVLHGTFSFEVFFPPWNQWALSFMFPVGVAWFASALAETSRTPFDFSEGESELVSGFNTEYSASPFIMFFLTEYSSLLFMSFLFMVLFLHPTFYSVVNSVKTTLVAFVFIWVRGTLPRLRYDKLMELAWKVFLPLSLVSLFFSFSVS